MSATSWTVLQRRDFVRSGTKAAARRTSRAAALAAERSRMRQAAFSPDERGAFDDGAATERLAARSSLPNTRPRKEAEAAARSSRQATIRIACAKMSLLPDFTEMILPETQIWRQLKGQTLLIIMRARKHKKSALCLFVMALFLLSCFP